MRNLCGHWEVNLCALTGSRFLLYGRSSGLVDLPEGMGSSFFFDKSSCFSFLLHYIALPNLAFAASTEIGRLTSEIRPNSRLVRKQLGDRALSSSEYSIKIPTQLNTASLCTHDDKPR